jgi:hypothetical protein
MRKLLTLTLGPALPVLLAAALAGCGGSDGDSGSAASSDRATATEAPHRSTTTVAPSTTETTEAPAAPTATETTEAPAAPTTATTTPVATPASSGRRYVCPEGGLDAVRELQASVDAGHQPWRLSAPDVAAGCTYGLGAATVEPVGPNHFRVTSTSTGERVLVTVAQPLGPGTVWAVTHIAPA